jgi:signal transduction histidine kinase
MFHSIRWRLIASYVLLAVMTITVVGFLAIEIVQTTSNQREVDEMQSSAQAIALQANSLVSQSARPFPLTQLVRTTAFLGNFRVRILDAQRNPLADSGVPGEWNDMVWIAPPQGTNLLSPSTNSSGLVMPLDHYQSGSLSSQLNNLPPGTSTTVIRKSYSPWGGRISFDAMSPDGKTIQTTDASKPRSSAIVSAPIGSAQDPKGYVELSDGPNYTAEALVTTQQAFLLAGAGAVLLATLIGLLMGSRLASPLHQLNAVAVEMGSGNLAARSAIHSKDEIGDLASTFNRMAERLQASFQELGTERDALRRFIADASHELRTPITALKNFNALLIGPAAGDTAAQSEFLAESEVQIDRLQWITQNLLNLSRIDAGLVHLDRGLCDVSDLMQAAAAPFKALAVDKGIQLNLLLPDPSFCVDCDRPRIELVASNLLDNAVKYTPSGGQIEMGTEKLANGHMRLWVQDSGSGIQGEDLPHIFERFYRGRNVSSPGSGLGLSIVASLVQAHGGKVWAESEQGQGAKFFVEL